MNKTLIAIVVIIIIIAGGWYVYQNQGSAPATGEPIKVGFIGPLSGDVSSLGEIAKEAADLAVKEINDAGGINGQPIELIAEDSQCEAKGGTNAVNKLISIDKVTAIIGGTCSSETAPAAPIAQQAGVPMISYCASAPGITKVGDYIFRDYPSDTFQSKFAAEYTYNTLKSRKVAVIYVKNDWGQGMRDGFISKFKELGGQIVYDESFNQDTRDFRTQLSKIKEANPNLIAVYAYTESGIPFLKQVKDLGIKVKIIGGDAWDDPTVPEKAGAASDGVLYTVTKLDIPDDFKTKFAAATNGKEVKICAPQAYDAIKLLAQVMVKSGIDRKMLRDELAKTSGYKGVSGTITFNEDGDIVDVNYIVKIMKDGKAEELK